MMVEWAQLKTFVDDRNLSIQSLDLSSRYWLKAFDGPFHLECVLDKTDNAVDVAEFEADYLPFANQPLKQEVLTQAEKNDRDKKLAKATATVNANSIGHIFIKCPGTINLDGNGMPIPNPTLDRCVNGGSIICNNAENGDFVEINITANNDPENLVIVKSFTEAEENSDAKNGWFMDSALGSMDLRTAAPAALYAGFYLHVVYHAVNAGAQRKVYLNVDWDQKEG